MSVISKPAAVEETTEKEKKKTVEITLMDLDASSQKIFLF